MHVVHGAVPVEVDIVASGAGVMTDSQDLNYVRLVRQRYQEEILTRYHAVGMGIGRQSPPGDGYAIVVYLQSRQDLPESPIKVEGVPLQFEVTGVIEPLSLRGE
jgi:hypothetical protein